LDLAKLYETQISFTEWFEKIGHASANEMRKEDNDKRERLSVLHKVLGLPFDKPYQFLATQILETSLVFKKFLKEHGDELCALRLIPLDNQLPKLRIRGRKIRDTLSWFNEQKIDPAKYRVDFVPHIEVSEWSTIFVVNQKGIFGEIIKGGHHQLTQGFYDQDKPLRFSYNFTDWQLSSKNEEAVRHLKEVIRYLHVGELSVQQKLKEVGCYRLQDSVFVTPQPCGEILKLIQQGFFLQKHVRGMVVTQIDDEEAVLRYFKLER